MWIKILETGTHKDRGGTIRTFTEADLDKVINRYNPQVHEAPVVIGYPRDNDPAYGWVQSLKREGHILFAKVASTISEFSEMINDGLFKNWFVTFTPDWSLRLIGVIGPKPLIPALQRLQNIQFKEGGNIMSFEFSEKNDPGEILHQKTMELLKSPSRFDQFGGELSDKLTYSQALDVVMRVNPELAKQYHDSLPGRRAAAKNIL